MQGTAIDSAEIFGYVASDFYPIDLLLGTIPSMHHRRITYLLVVAGATLWCAGILAAPLCTTMGGTPARPGNLIYQFYQPICHQLPERSYFLFDFPIGVCSRCTAIYFAFLVGTLLYPLVRRLDNFTLPPRWVMIAAALPMLVDATWIGPLLYEVTLFTRGLTGACCGIVLPFILLPVVLQAIDELVAPSVRSHQQKGLSNAQ
jgi:uncharacterized membrane protein